MATTLHSTLPGSELHYSKINVISGTPANIPEYIGQSVFDSLNKIFYVAVGTASPSDWQSLSGVGGDTSVQDISTTTYTVSANDNNTVLTFTNVAARTVTLLTAPINGFEITIHDGAGTAHTANITVMAGGSDDFDNGTNTFTIDSNFSSYLFIYDFDNTRWIVKCSYIGQNVTATTVTATDMTVTDTITALHIAGTSTAAITTLNNITTINTLAATDLNINCPGASNDIKLNINSVNVFDIDSANLVVNLSGHNTFTLTDTSLNLAFNNVSALTGSTTDFIFKKTVTFDDITDITKQLTFSISGATTGTKTTLAAVQSTNITLTLPDITDILVTKNSVDILTNKSVQNLKFNNPSNTFYTNVIGGNNSGNLTITLPTTAPLANQLLSSADTSGSLTWVNAPISNQQTVTASGTITALASDTAVVLLTGSVDVSIQGITAGAAGQYLTLKNISSSNIYIIRNNDASAPASNRIRTPNSFDIFIEPGFSLDLFYDTNSSRWNAISPLNAGTTFGLYHGETVPQYFVGEVVDTSHSPTSVNIQTSSTYFTIMSLALTPGKWVISAQIQLYLLGTIASVANPNVQLILDKDLASNATPYNLYKMDFYPATYTNSLYVPVTMSLYQNVSSNYTYSVYAITDGLSGTTTAEASAYIRAVRIS